MHESLHFRREHETPSAVRTAIWGHRSGTPLTLLHDGVVYRRTSLGQRELTDRHAHLSLLERRFLSAITGHSPLRVLLDLGLDRPGIGEAIVSLVRRGHIKLESDS